MIDPQTHVLTEFESTTSVYASFKQRALALLLDGLILSPLAVIDWFNKTGWKSPMLLFIVFAVGLVYKPFLEFKKGATIGKQAMNILVVNNSGSQLSVQQAVLRNIFDIAFRTFTFIATLIIYSSAGFSSIITNNDYILFQQTIINFNPYIIFYMLIVIIEIILVLSDKARRSLHDRIGNTYVVKSGMRVQPENY
jgi:uncharacterized RDD family membrane protein YckC